ncbi:Protein GLUTAMINE DUMPER 1 [Bienertia sinuspersici]
MMKNETITSSSSSKTNNNSSTMVDENIHRSNTPIPYLFGGLALMLCLIAIALLILACSFRKSTSSSNGNNNNDTSFDGNRKSTSKNSTLGCGNEPKLVVIMAGDENPTYLAKPLPSPMDFDVNGELYRMGPSLKEHQLPLGNLLDRLYHLKNEYNSQNSQNLFMVNNVSHSASNKAYLWHLRLASGRLATTISSGCCCPAARWLLGLDVWLLPSAVAVASGSLAVTAVGRWWLMPVDGALAARGCHGHLDLFL